ncbi:bifunctional solanapyrone synthase [Colletotrichum tofieldiae]|nr:bifunctional solanapyrone synthase [Colletotrichum tofieldiae]GKT92247.1 bifunctional solanapyrone synthase [Colletotrichum tofieldiae]
MSSRATYDPSQTERALDNAFEPFAKPGLADEENMGFDMYYAYNQAEDEFTLTGSEWYENPIASPPVFDALRQVPTVRRSTTLATMANLTSVPQQLGIVRLEIFQDEVQAVRDVEGITPNFICYSLPKNSIAAMSRRGGNALGITGDQPILTWSNATGDAAIASMTDNIIHRVRSASISLGASHPFLFMNYASATQAQDIFHCMA